MAMWTPSILIFLLAAGLAWYAAQQWRAAKHAVRQAEASLRWPKALGCVIHSQVVHEVTDTDLPAFYVPSVSYQYVVNGTTYSSTQIALRSLQSYHKSAAAIVARYPVGGEVQVSYDPQSPQTSLLEPGAEGLGRAFFFAGVGFFISLTMVAVGIAMPILKSLP